MLAELRDNQGRLRMNLRTEWKPLALITGGFLAALFMPVGLPRLQNAVMESLYLLHDYASKHVVLCLLPAFLIAGGISVFLKGDAVMRYLGAGAKKVVAYGVASVSGTILAVCSCTVLPLFAGIYRRGAGIGPATAFLYSGPAINVLAIILTARVLGLGLGVARAVGAVVFGIVIGLLMHFFFRREEQGRMDALQASPAPREENPLHRTILLFASLVAILVFSNWGSNEEAPGFWSLVQSSKWLITGGAALLLGLMARSWLRVIWWKLAITGSAVLLLALLVPGNPTLAFGVGLVGLAASLGTTRGEASSWLDESWGFARQVMPLLFAGILVSGFLLGRPGMEGMIPSSWVEGAVGGNSLWANLFASVAGAFMYFATLTEVPILQGLIGAGMGQGPALALLLAGPALSLPSMLVIGSIMGARKTLVYIALVVTMSTLTGLIYGAIV
jgi:uncharacterized membrane protein YraQ (UPF0718 family)